MLYDIRTSEKAATTLEALTGVSRTIWLAEQYKNYGRIDYTYADDYAFVPIRHEDEICYLYEIVKYERHPIGEIKRVAERKKLVSYYIFQLSDLHFGSKNVDIAERRLKSLIKTQLASIELEDDVNFLITGYAVDSPK